MNRIQELLTRKLGPLPAWVWLGVFALGVYYYRNRLTKAGANTATSTTGQTVDTGTPRDPVTLDPGQSLYDPSTGAVIGTAPGQHDPVTLEPGECLVNPATGAVECNPTTGADTTPAPGPPAGSPPPPAGGKKPPTHKHPPPESITHRYKPVKPRRPKRKPKPAHGGGHPAPKPGHGATRPRGGAGTHGTGGHTPGTGRGRGKPAEPYGNHRHTGGVAVVPGHRAPPAHRQLESPGARRNPGAQPGGAIQRQRTAPPAHAPAAPHPAPHPAPRATRARKR